MTSLFSSFDMFFFKNSWLVMFTLMSSICISFYKHNSFFYFMNYFFNKMSIFLFSLKPLSFNKMSSLLGLSAMVMILGANLFSVFPFIFPLTSQFGVIMGFSLVLWLSFMLFSLFSNPNSFLSHFIPEGSPMILSLFLFLIELVSNVIRPLTLTVRLVANILAGHLLMILLSKMVLSMNMFIFFYMILNLVELMVSLIQSYIFCTMAILYFSEVH